MRNPILLALLVAFPALGQPAPAQDDVVFHSGVSLVRVDAQVVDADGRVLAGLVKDDFRVLEGGREQPLVNFSFEREPLDLILLFDTAGSMRGKLLQVVRAIELGFQELRKGDRVCVMAFNQNASEIAPFNADLEAVNGTIVVNVPALHFAGGSNPEAAADTAALRFRREPKTQRRRAVLIVTDRNTSKAEPDTIHQLWESDAVLSELILGHGTQTRIMEPGTNQIVDGTGGAVVVAGTPGPAFEESLRGLRSRYTLYYGLPPAERNTERSIKVELSPAAAKRYPGSRVRARTGYIARNAETR